MATWDDVRRLIGELPETTENERTWRVRKKVVAWDRPLRAKDYAVLAESAWPGEILGARTSDVGAREALLADDPDVYFTTPHFDGYPAVLVRLERIGEDELRELLGEAWLAQAPKRLARTYLDALNAADPLDPPEGLADRPVRRRSVGRVPPSPLPDSPLPDTALPDSPFHDLDAFVDLPRVTGLALSVDGSRLVATVAAPDADRSVYVNALWEIDPSGAGAPVRLTYSAEGESGATFLPDGSLLFTSDRPDPRMKEAEGKALWRLPPVGEASVVARASGGLSDPVADPTSTLVLVGGSRLVAGGPVDTAGPGDVAGPGDIADPGEADAADRKDRKRRRESKASGILHDGMPIRYWDRELGETSPRLFVVDAGATEDGEPARRMRDLAPDAGFALQDTEVSSAGGRALCTWTSREPRGLTRTDVVSIDLARRAPDRVVRTRLRLLGAAAGPERRGVRRGTTDPRHVRDAARRAAPDPPAGRRSGHRSGRCRARRPDRHRLRLGR